MKIQAIFETIPKTIRKNIHLRISNINLPEAYISMDKRILTISIFYEKMDEDVILFTIYHELSHLSDIYFYRIPFYIPFSKKYRCYSYVDEIHADFYAAKELQLTKERAIHIIQIKQQFARTQNSTISHPSWEQRILFLQKGECNQTIVNPVKEMIGYKGEIQYFYAEIYLA